MSEREDLIRILDEQGAQSGDCGHEPGSITDCPNECRAVLEGYADAILSAGYRKTRVSRVRELHKPVWSANVPPGGYVCKTCGVPVESEPCPTIQALED